MAQWTIMQNGEIGAFVAWPTREEAEKIADIYRSSAPADSFVVVPDTRSTPFERILPIRPRIGG